MKGFSHLDDLLPPGERNRPLVRPPGPRAGVEAIAIAFACKVGTTVFEYKARDSFRPTELFATDTSGQRATRIQEICVNRRVQSVRDVPTWLFSEWMSDAEYTACKAGAALLGTHLESASIRQAAAQLRMVEAVRSLTWDMWNMGSVVEFKIDSDVACRWEGAFFGKVLR